MRAHAALAVAALAALAACAERPRPVASRQFFVDQQGGARACTTTPPRPLTLTGAAEAQMTVVNDGGWCGVTVQQPGGRAFAAGLVNARPANGRLHVRQVGDATRVDYYPDPGFSGSDAFTVAMVPGGAQLRVAVTVQPGAAPAATAAAPVAAPVTSPARPAARSSRTPARNR